jgi:serine phosphatase RsbU (regulator of sigma subunit)/ligand-binding sensor domain-containing protein
MKSKTSRKPPFRLMIVRAPLRVGALLTIVLLSLDAVSAQQQARYFERLSLEEGLSQSIVECIVQDQRGFMWFGTEDGLNLFDGYTFTVIRSSPRNPHGIVYNHITALCVDRSGTLWVGTFTGGLTRYFPASNEFVQYRFSSSDSSSLSNDVVNVIFLDRSGNLWVGTSYGLNRVVFDTCEPQRAMFVRYQNDPSDPSSLSHSTVRSVAQDAQGRLWVGTDGGLSVLTPEELIKPRPRFLRFSHDSRNEQSLSNDQTRTVYVDRAGVVWIGTDNGLNKALLLQGDLARTAFKHYHHVPERATTLSHDQVYALLEDSSGTFWIGTNGGGLNVMDRTRETFVHYRTDPRDPTSLSYDEIRAIYEDRSGIVWVGTYGGGVNKFDGRKKQFNLYRPEPGNPNSLSQEIVWTLFEDQDGILWIGTHGGGLNRFDRKANRFSVYRSDPNNARSLSSDFVRLVIGDPSGDLWIGTNGGGICRMNRHSGVFTRYVHDPRDPGSLNHDQIRALYLDHRGDLWIGTYGGGLDRLTRTAMTDPKPSFIHYRHRVGDTTAIGSDFIRTVFEDRSGNLWIGTHGGGLSRLDRSKGTFRHYRANALDSTSLNNDYVFCIYEDADGILWMATWGGGLNRYDPRTDSFTNLTSRNGLPSDAIYGILEDSQGNLWLSTNNGLSRFSPRKRVFRNYTVRDGLNSREFNGGSFFKSPSGEMFFGGIHGFNTFYPEKIEDNPFVPPVVLTSFRKLNEEFSFGKPLTEVEVITLSHSDYFFSFEFASLDYTAPNENLYAYKMEGLDDRWITTSASKRYASYTTLPPGEYTFRVIGSNSDGVWNKKGASVRVTITPAYWQTWWFRLGILLTALAIGLVAYRRRLRTERMKAELRAAHNAQMTIMPQTDPELSGYDISGLCFPANEVGGDFFDYFWLDLDRTQFGVVVGDVSGKAMQAAMTAVMASGMINAETGNGCSISGILRKTNSLLYPKTQRQMFTAVCLLSLGVKKKLLTFANAGLNKPLLRSSSGVSLLEPTGTTHPLGMLPQSEYRERSVPLASGDVVLLHTDGILEAQDRARHMYGEERLIRLLATTNVTSASAREIRDALLRDVQEFTSSAPQHDDMTVVVIKVL